MFQSVIQHTQKINYSSANKSSLLKYIVNLDNGKIGQVAILAVSSFQSHSVQTTINMFVIKSRKKTIDPTGFTISQTSTPVTIILNK